MKTLLVIVATLSVAVLAACEHKTDMEPKVSTVPGEQLQKAAEPLSVPAVPKNVQQSAGLVKEAAKPISVSAVEGAKKSTITQPAPVKEATEQDLAATVDHARDVTKSQVSGSRQHAQKAEDEMADLLKNK